MRRWSRRSCIRSSRASRTSPSGIPSLRLISTGSAPISEQTLLGTRAAFRCDVVHSYGLTESAAALSTMAPREYVPGPDGRPTRLRSAGRALPETELRIVDDEGAPSRGRRDRGARAATHAWLLAPAGGHGGDAQGRLAPHRRHRNAGRGRLPVHPGSAEGRHHHGRAQRISPDGRARAAGASSVLEAAVIGVPDARWGESVRAVIVTRPARPPRSQC